MRIDCSGERIVLGSIGLSSSLPKMVHGGLAYTPETQTVVGTFDKVLTVLAVKAVKSPRVPSILLYVVPCMYVCVFIKTRVVVYVYLANCEFVCVFVCVCFLLIYSGRQACWTYQPGSHRKKVTQDLSSTSLLRCLP